MPLSSKNRFDVLTVENISDFETMEAVQTSEHSPCDMPRTETFRSVRISKNENEPQIESTLSAQFSKNRNTPHIESILSAHISKNGNRPHIETIRSVLGMPKSGSVRFAAFFGEPRTGLMVRFRHLAEPWTGLRFR